MTVAALASVTSAVEYTETKIIEIRIRIKTVMTTVIIILTMVIITMIIETK